MTPDKAVERLNAILAHAWMIRTFLKHADEIQESAEMLDVPRTLYDAARESLKEALRSKKRPAEILHFALRERAEDGDGEGSSSPLGTCGPRRLVPS